MFHNAHRISMWNMHRFSEDFGLSAGLAFRGSKNTAVRAGVAGEF